MENIFIVWTNYQARVEGISEDLGRYLGDFKIIYRENPSASKVKKIGNYVKYFFNDLQLIMNSNTSRIFVQIPPSYSLLAPIMIKKLFKKKITIIADCHNAMTREPWLKRFGSKYLIKNTDLVVLHNDVIYRRKANFFPFLSAEKIVVLEDKTLDKESSSMFMNEIEGHPYVFIPSSFNLDEPVKEVVKAASLLPEINFVVTGNPNKLSLNFNIDQTQLPKNLILTGWLSNEDYRRYLTQADILMGLTVYDDIQMSVSNEGLGAGKVMVLSDKEALKEIYNDCAIYTENDAYSICTAIKYALNHKSDILKKIMNVQELKNKRYKKQIKSLVAKIQG